MIKFNRYHFERVRKWCRVNCYNMTDLYVKQLKQSLTQIIVYYCCLFFEERGCWRYIRWVNPTQISISRGLLWQTKPYFNVSTCTMSVCTSMKTYCSASITVDIPWNLEPNTIIVFQYPKIFAETDICKLIIMWRHSSLNSYSYSQILHTQKQKHRSPSNNEPQLKF